MTWTRSGVVASRRAGDRLELAALAHLEVRGREIGDRGAFLRHDRREHRARRVRLDAHGPRLRGRTRQHQRDAHRGSDRHSHADRHTSSDHFALLRSFDAVAHSRMTVK